MPVHRLGRVRRGVSRRDARDTLLTVALRPCIYGPDQIPAMTDPVQVAANPALATLSVMAHGDRPDVGEAFKRIAAEAATTASTTATVDAIMRLGKMGLPSRDIAAILGISFQYAAAVLSHPKKDTTSSRPSEPRQRRAIGTRAKTEPVALAQRSRRKIEA